MEYQSFLTSKTIILGFGAPRSGTTWVAHYLRDHPDVFVSSIKELHFFRYSAHSENWPNSFFTKQLKKSKNPNGARAGDLRERLLFNDDLTKYIHFFASRMDKQTHFCDITPAYCMLPSSELIRIKETFPSIKPFFIMRNPIDRFWSQFQFSLRVADNSAVEKGFSQALTQPKFLNRSDYQSTVERLTEVFGDQMFFGFYEDLISESGVKKFCAFLGVPYQQPNLGRFTNISSNIRIQPSHREVLAKLLESQYRYCHERFGDSLPDSWLKDFDLFS